MRILVTGGCGFIGSNFVNWTLEHHPQAEVVNLDKLTYAGNPENLESLRDDPRYSFIQGDICDRRKVDEAFSREPELVVNFAAETHVDRSILEPEAFLQTDIYGTFQLLEAVRRYGTPRYLQISTDEVYGSIESGSFNEESLIKPSSPYAASKAGADLLVRSYVHTYGTPALIVRSSNNFGPRQYPEKVIPLFITNLLEGRKVPLYGDGLNVRDWLFVEDNCAAIDAVLRRGVAGEVYNVGGGREVTNLELTQRLLELLGRDESSIEYVPDRPGHDRRYSITRDKVEELGWRPARDFPEALGATVAWYRENEAWWKRIKSGEFRDYYEKQYGSKA